jgi:hypothetical protein
MPTTSDGLTAEIEAEELTVKLVASTAPNLTFVACVKPVPVMFTTVPPEKGPLVGDSFVTVGGNPGATVSNVWSEPLAVPPSLVALMRKWYVVEGASPVATADTPTGAVPAPGADEHGIVVP